MREKQKAVKRSLVTANFSTVLSIALVLFVLSGIVLFSFHALQFSDQMKEDVSFTVYMTDDATEEQVIKLTEEIRKDNIVKSASYISKTESVKIMDKLMGEGHLDVLDGYNPYQASIEVHLKAGSFSVKQINQFIRTQESKSIVESVDYRDDLINNINSDIYDASVFFVVILIALLIISVTLINHTINLTISNKKLLIRSMQLVGANASFVRRPFLLKGLWLGFFGGLLSDIFSCAVIIWVYTLLQGYDIKAYYSFYIVLGIAILLLGMLLTFVFSYIAVIRNMNLKNYKLYN